MRIKRSPFKPRAKTGLYKIESKADEATVYIYDEISWFGISAEEFIKDLNDITAKTVHIRFNSPGGSVFDGIAVFNAIKQHKSKTISHIDGFAASISSVIALASDEVRMAENAFLMIHDPWSIVIGNADTMRDEAKLLDKVGGVIAKAYIDKTGKEEKEIKALMNAETWMTADEAKEMGFIDVIDKDEEDEKAKATLFDLSVFVKGEEMEKIIAEKQGEAKKEPDKRTAEKALRDAGFSRNDALKIVAKGFQDESDSQTEPINQDVSDSQNEDSAPQSDSDKAKLTEKEEKQIVNDKTNMLLKRANNITNFKGEQ